MERVLHRFEFSAQEKDGVGIRCAVEMRNAASMSKINGPCGVLIIARTKESPHSALNYMVSSIKALANSGLLQTDRIRQFHFDKISSFEEVIEIFIIALND